MEYSVHLVQMITSYCKFRRITAFVLESAKRGLSIYSKSDIKPRCEKLKRVQLYQGTPPYDEVPMTTRTRYLVSTFFSQRGAFCSWSKLHGITFITPYWLGNYFPMEARDYTWNCPYYSPANDDLPRCGMNGIPSVQGGIYQHLTKSLACLPWQESGVKRCPFGYTK